MDNRCTYIYNGTTGLQGEVDVDMSAIGHAFARSVDEGKVQASNQVLWDVHLDRAGLAQHWNCKRSAQNKSLHYKPTSELGMGYTTYNWGKKTGIIDSICDYDLTTVTQLPILHSHLHNTNQSCHCPKFSSHSRASKTTKTITALAAET